MTFFFRLALITTLTLLCNGCLTFVTYYSVPSEQIPTQIHLGPPESYEVLQYGDRSILRIGHRATTWWGAFRVYSTDSPAEYSAVRESSAEFSRTFQIYHVQQAPYLVSQAGFIADLSRLGGTQRAARLSASRKRSAQPGTSCAHHPTRGKKHRISDSAFGRHANNIVATVSAPPVCSVFILQRHPVLDRKSATPGGNPCQLITFQNLSFS